MIIEKVKKLMEHGYICDRCLGRQFAMLLSGMSNAERGKIIRFVIAMEYDAKSNKIDTSNFYGINMRSDVKNVKGVCFVCNNLMEKIEDIAMKIVNILKDYEFKTFLVGIKLSDELVVKEEDVWSLIGNEYSESIKSELSREIGKIVEKHTKKVFNKNPDVTIIYDIETNNFSVISKSLFIYGEYKKLKRGIPQTKWDKYKITVEDIISKPFVRMCKTKKHILHAMGREDIDARCLAYRPFVLEMKNPKTHVVDLKMARMEINKSGIVKVRKLKICNKNRVVEIKNCNADKIYRVLVEFETKPDSEELKHMLSMLPIKIMQKTPKRVLHRRKDKLRFREIKEMKFRKFNGNIYEFTIRASAGTYIKEFVHGDNGRTKPSISSILKRDAIVKELDVIKIVLK